MQVSIRIAALAGFCVAAIAGLAAALSAPMPSKVPALSAAERSLFRAAVTPQSHDSAIWAVAIYSRGSFAFPLVGRRLPMGDGNAADGGKVFAERCAACHSLRNGRPAEIGRCWRHAKPLFDFVKRAMPHNAPGSLSDDDVYAVLAYLLANVGIVKPNAILNEIRLAQVVMPNRDGLIPNSCPELSLYR